MFKFFKSVVAVLFMAFLISLLTGFAVLPVFGVLFIVGCLMFIARVQNDGIDSYAYEGLNTEVWLGDVLPEKFYPKTSFLSAVRDLSSLVDNNTINLAEAGADPAVLVNNTVYPVPITEPNEAALTVSLKTYDTENTVIRNATAVELAYDKRALYVDKHQRALATKFGVDAAWAYAPQAHDASKFNNIINMGANDSVIDAFIDQKAHFMKANADSMDMVCVLNPEHMAKIAKEDKVLYKAIMAEPGGIFYGFRMYESSQLPIYTAAGTKAALGAAFVEGTHKQASIFFLGSEVCKAMGTIEFFSRLKDPEARGDVFGFQARFTASSFRNKYMGAILQ